MHYLQVLFRRLVLRTFVETFMKSMDNGRVVGAVLMDLSKASYCLNHELLIAKLDASGFSSSALFFIHSYSNDREQGVKASGLFCT